MTTGQPATKTAATLPDALIAARRVFASSSRDWGTDRDLAWLYGVFVGWADDEFDSWHLMADRHGWSPGDVERLRALRATVEGVTGR